jgi:starch phosphorylase
MAKQKTLHEKLRELGNNLWWSWQPEVTQIFRDIDPTLWTDVGHNPVLLLEQYPPETLEKRATEAVLHTRINWAYRRWQEYMQATDTWGATHTGVLGHRPTAYFSAEFGVHESLPIYSGGLGVLAGDHLKSASDLGIPLVSVGLFYGQGYFQQHLDDNGWQQETYTDLSIGKLPIEPALSSAGKPFLISVDTRGGKIHARVWKINVGRIPLYLLDTDVPENRDEDRHLTSRLYGGDQRTRIRQEIILGIGGVRALAAMGINPGVIHMNEGHSAFAGLEVIRQRMKEDTETLAELMLHAEQFCSKVENAMEDVAPLAEQTELRLKLGQCKNQLVYLQEFYNAGNLSIESAEVRAIFRQLVTALLWIAFYARSAIDYKTYRRLVLIEHGFAYLLASR